MIARAVRSLPFLTVLALAIVAIVAAAGAPARQRLDGSTPATAAVQTSSATWWRHKARANARRVRSLRRELLRRWDYPTLIAIAATAYGVDEATLERKARCESVNFTDFHNEKSGASNVMQFLPSTWATTPYARFSIWNPFAAVLAGAWMHKTGRGSEWVCP